VVKTAYQESHFLLFASQSEGWPKVVAESMFWGCLPITSTVSCVPEMVGNGLRGDLVEPKAQAMSCRIEYYLNNSKEYQDKCENAMSWSRQFTLERFEEEINKFLI
jgi:glycosyltransferase involved in cell wall biosynthesis